MSQKLDKSVAQKEVVQAVVIAEHFGNEFMPITDDTPLTLLPLLNVPLLEYTLEFLSLGGIEETFLFCCSNVVMIKQHINSSIEKSAGWSLTMKVHVIVSETCRSFGDCIRDLDAKALIRGDFVLLEPGIVGNIKLLPIIKKHNETCNTDKGAAMTLILQEAGLGQRGRCSFEEVLMVATPNNRVLLHQKLGTSKKAKIELPLEILMDNASVNIYHNLKDTHISICSPNVLSLFSDNFDFQTKDDFVRGLLINEEILGSTIYWHLIKGNQYGAAVTNWRMYQSVSRDILHRWLYPLVPDMGISSQQRSYIHLQNNVYRSKDVHLTQSNSLIEDVIIGGGSSVGDKTRISRSIIGESVKIGDNVIIEDSFVFSNTVIGDNSVIQHSIIGQKCVLETGCIVTKASVIGKGVVLPENSIIENYLIRSHSSKTGVASNKLAKNAYHIKPEESVESDAEDDGLHRKLSRLYMPDEAEPSDDESVKSSESEDNLSYTISPVPDDTNLFLTEVVDSLTRGFEDKLQCDNLILEINSSRYAYNVSVKEVNFNVIKAILMLPFQLYLGQPYLPSLRPLLDYFSPILKNYIRNISAMVDCLQAIEDVAANNNELNECVSAVLNWLYNKDHLSEDVILNWFSGIDKNTRFYARVEPFTNWLQQAEEASSSEED
ncbi:hypothetical protein PPYR_06952 [Photinus pyralis]|uniref:Translation initiation factor eIF2B subunit epsilon n=2 Tax=Photinus pyralis TaxID=7054 RepID=A0A1Y1NJA6_PHOPY|nr:translation initiation factor eIF-2B subunit epsilon-like [Photinus pyralis]KAB0799072.1 hypothetical protein PPYR_06952 [Photinus pyralis]